MTNPDDDGYEALAASQDDEDRAYHAAMRARRRDRGDFELPPEATEQLWRLVRPNAGDTVVHADHAGVLPAGTVLLDKNGDAWQIRERDDLYMARAGDASPYFLDSSEEGERWREIAPFTILWVPGEIKRGIRRA